MNAVELQRNCWSFLTRELRACARASCKYDMENGTHSLVRAFARPLDCLIPVNFFSVLGLKEFFFRFSFNKRRQRLAGMQGFTLK